MLLNILSHLPAQFQFLTDQIHDGLIRGFLKNDWAIANFYKVIYNVAILNKYEKKELGSFRITGPEVFDLNSNKYTRIDIYYYSHVLMGYASPMVKEVKPDPQNVRVLKYFLQPMENEDYEKSKALLDKAALGKVNPNDVYELVLDGKRYYHLKDLEDGDFIGIDEDKKVYKITHDPYAFVELKGPLGDILERKDLRNL